MAADMSDPVYTEIVTARIKLLLEKPFFGNLATRLIAVEAPWCRTAATDGRHLYYNREFIKGLSRPHLLFLIAHEVMHCSIPGTIIPGAWKAIEEFGIGDSVIGNGGIHSKVVMPMSRQYDGDLITIKARGMLSVPMTTEHPVLVSRPRWVEGANPKTGTRTQVRAFSEAEFVAAKDVKRGDWVQIPRVKGNVTDYVMEFSFTGNPWSSPPKMRDGVKLDADVAEFLGYYVAEGSTSTTNGDYVSSIVLNANERITAQRLQILLNDRFGVASSIQDVAVSNSIRLQFSSKPLGKWLQENCGIGSHNKTLPNAILYNTDLDVLTGFLRGYTDGDGSTGSYGVNCATVSKVLALQLQMAWARLGILLNFVEDNGQKTSVIRGQNVTSGVIYRGATTRNDAVELLGKEAKTKNRPTLYAVVTDEAIFTPVSKVIVAQYSGPVYNFETTCNTYAMANMMTHNCIYDHLGRRGSRDPKIWNMATDYNINFGLVREKVGSMPEMGLYDAKYTDEMSADEIYELLKKNSVTIKMPLDDHLDLGNDSDDGDGDDGDPIDRDGNNRAKKGSGDEEDGDDGDDGKPGKGKGGKGKPGSGKGKGKSTEVTVMGKDGPPKLTEEDLQKIRNDLKAAVIQTAQQVGAGNVPLGVKRLISELVEPKLDWKALLDAHIRSQVKDDYTFQRLSRRTWGTGAIMPAQNHLDRVECVCAIDASGSTSTEMITHFLSEIRGIMTGFRDYKIGVMTFDSEVYNWYEFTPENEDDVYNYVVKGGGGTLFSAVYEFMKREGIEPARLIFLTDGLPNDGWGDPEYADTIFVIHSNPHITAPHGLTAWISDDEFKPRK